ncbi:MAG: hypothetical protein KDA41_14000, partial [Planctomycetales bacterium]|nr:hypothetical protein [Planctomycetales bacterium]
MIALFNANRHAIAAHAAIAVLFCAGGYCAFLLPGQAGGDIAYFQRQLETRRPTLVLVGNSLLRAAVDDGEFSQLSGVSTLAATSDGSSSLWWYLYVKNVVASARHKPRYLAIMFRDTYLTEPAFRVDGNYQKPIRRMMTSDEPLVQRLSYGGDALGDINSPINWAPREARNWLNYKIEKRVEDIVDCRRGQGREALRRVFAAEK